MVQDQDNLIGPQILADVASLKGVITTNKASSLWGIAPTAPIHLGYDSLIVAQNEMLRLGLQHTVLLADYHAMLTHGCSLAEISQRATYYENYLQHCCGLSATFVRGSSFQSRPHYVESLYSAMSALPISRVKESLSKVLKGEGADKTMVSTYFYGMMQCLDCCYLSADVVFAEQGQAKIYQLLDAIPGKSISGNKHFSRAHKNDADHKPSVFIYVPTGCDIKGQPLNQSRAQDRISIHETKESLEKKIARMFAAPAGQALPPNRANAILEFFKNSVFPWQSHPVEVSDVNKSKRAYSSFDNFQSDYQAGVLHPNDCKAALLAALWERLRTIQAAMGSCICDWVDTAKARGE